MKKLVFLFVFSLFSMSMAAKDSFRPHWKFMDEPVRITVKGIDFFIFPNGEFDFNAHQIHNRHYGKRHMGVRIERNRYGEIRRVGNVFINYNRHGQVSRIGNVFIRYNRRGLVAEVGKIKLKYQGKKYVVIRLRPHIGINASIYYGPSPAYVYDGLYYDNYNDHYIESDYYYKTKNDIKRKVLTKGRRR